MIIAFCGKAGSGKDTAAAYLIKNYGFERRAFADPLKRSFAALFNITVADVNRLKLDENTHITVHQNYTLVHNEDPKITEEKSLPISTMTFRHGLQRYGDEAHKPVFGEDVWVDLTLPVGGFYAGRKIAISDLRFPCEAERVKELGGIVVRIERAVSLLKTPTEAGHRSEILMDRIQSNHILTNRGTIEELYEQIDEMLGIQFQENTTNAN